MVYNNNKTGDTVVSDQILLATWEVLKNSHKRNEKKSSVKSAELAQAKILALQTLLYHPSPQEIIKAVPTDQTELTFVQTKLIVRLIL